MKKSYIIKIFKILVSTIILALFALFLLFENKSITIQNSDINSSEYVYHKRQENLEVRSFPDPTGLFYNGKYYAYSTSSGNVAIPLATSEDNKNYQVIDNALQNKPEWATGGLWAPDIFYNGNKFVLYFTATNENTTKRVIGLATSWSPKGPFVSSADILTSNDSLGGIIDPEQFQDSDGKRYLLYKNDGNSIDKTSQLWIQDLSEDGLKTSGSATSILTNEDVSNPKDNGDNNIATTIENPCIVKAPDGKYVLFFSGNNYGTKYYFTGYAISDKLKGPYKYAGPLITTNSQEGDDIIVGPGGADVIKKDKNDYYMLLHGWVGDVDSIDTRIRKLYVKTIEWKDGHIPQVK